MKIIITTLFTCFFFISNAQNTNEELTISFQDKTLKEVIQKIEDQSSYKFFYLNDWLNDNKISGNYTNKTVSFILKDVLKNTLINFIF